MAEITQIKPPLTWGPSHVLYIDVVETLFYALSHVKDKIEIYYTLIIKIQCVYLHQRAPRLKFEPKSSVVSKC